MSYSGVMRLALAIAVAGVLLVPLLPSARAPPLIPYEAWGVAKTSAGASIGINQPIRTFIDGVDYSNLTSTYKADGSYQTQIAGNWYIGPTSETPNLKEGGDPNDPVMFAHGDMTVTGIVFQETAAWVTAGFQNLDLNEGVAASQPALLKIQSVTTRPADGLTQYAYICNPTASPVDLSKYYFQRDAPTGFGGPQVALTGTVGANQKIFADFLSNAYVTNNGDALKLVYDNTPGVGSPNGGGDIVIDRVEFNASSGGALTWEPGNTIMSDAPAPDVAPSTGHEIHRSTSCADTNQGSDFTVGPETTRPTRPTVAVTSPNGGERWTGASPHGITFTLQDAQDPNAALVVNITYSTDSGATYPNLIVANRAGTGNPNSYTWTLPTIDTSTARVLVCARDTTSLLGCDASNNDFTIDSTNPTVTGHIPTSGQTGVPVNQDVIVTFSELMDQASVQNNFQIAPTPLGMNFMWSGPTMTLTHAAFNQGTVYQVTIGTGSKDTSLPGLNVIPAVQWSFTTFQNNAPTVAITAPAASGLCWSGGVPHTISWTMSDAETPANQLVVYINYSSSAGSGAVAGPLVGVSTYDWTPANTLNAPDVRIAVTVIDTGGASRTDQSLAFKVDSTPPTMTPLNPTAGATSVAATQDIIIQFSESMDVNSVRNGLTISPLVGNLGYNWAGTTLTVTHVRFMSATQYTVTLNNARDACTPGLALSGSNSYSFTTAANQLPTATFTSPAAGAQFSPGQTIPIAWTMSDQETAPANLVVYLNYTSSAGGGTVSGRLVGATSFAWTAPQIDASDVKIVLTVIDDQGGSTTVQSGAFSIRSGGGGIDVLLLGGILAVIVIAVIGALLYFLVFAKRRRKEETLPPPPVAPARAPAARAPARPPGGPPAAPTGATKECPSCGTIIDAKDPECFMCGHKF